jgi:hypothetical protein
MAPAPLTGQTLMDCVRLRRTLDPGTCSTLRSRFGWFHQNFGGYLNRESSWPDGVCGLISVRKSVRATTERSGVRFPSGAQRKKPRIAAMRFGLFRQVSELRSARYLACLELDPEFSDFSVNRGP